MVDDMPEGMEPSTPVEASDTETMQTVRVDVLMVTACGHSWTRTQLDAYAQRGMPGVTCQTCADATGIRYTPPEGR